MRALLLAVFLASCGAHHSGDAIALPADPKPDLRPCPTGGAIPEPPAHPRTVESVGIWARGLDDAARSKDAAVRNCARRFDELSRWIGRQQGTTSTPR